MTTTDTRAATPTRHATGPRADCPATACRWHDVEQLPASELRALRDRIDTVMRQFGEAVDEIETIRAHYNLAGVMPTRYGGWVTVASLLPEAELLDQLVSGGTIYYETEPAPEELRESGSISDALGTISAGYLAQELAERAAQAAEGAA